MAIKLPYTLADVQNYIADKAAAGITVSPKSAKRQFQRLTTTAAQQTKSPKTTTLSPELAKRVDELKKIGEVKRAEKVEAIKPKVEPKPKAQKNDDGLTASQILRAAKKRLRDGETTMTVTARYNVSYSSSKDSRANKSRPVQFDLYDDEIEMLLGSKTLKEFAKNLSQTSDGEFLQGTGGAADIEKISFD